MKKYLSFYALVSIVAVFMLQSCNKENDIINESVNSDGNTIKKEFKISESWFDNGNDSLRLKSTPIGDIYNNFGEGINVISNQARNSIFDVQTSLEPLVATTLEEKTSMKFVATSDYHSIEEGVKTALASSLGIDVWKVELDASLSVTEQSSISRDMSSVYVSVLYVKRYGKGRLQFTHPTINNYLIYSTGMHDANGIDGINIDNTTFRNIYGDKFKSIITFGCLLNATIQITNVDFNGKQRSEIEADAKAKIGRWFNASATWESLSENSEFFHSSSLVIDGTIIPRGGLIRSLDDLITEVDKLDQLYANNDFGVLLNSYDLYSSLYQTYDFKSIQFFQDQIDKIDPLIYYTAAFNDRTRGEFATREGELWIEREKYVNLETMQSFNEKPYIDDIMYPILVYRIDDWLGFNDFMSAYYN